ncbi:myelin-oligodendrocyte glycoprotein-like isoform X1 [Echeneis naucrates]|uniref:Myelin-oligodendrocyte glycoprotein-like n=1 Tax=Echeneis naucrates TaxID=173247 RepID=A0A665TGN7_ECHNA|nr:myelin-oligodendrocyte glycoprotein-like isoform X1 [Echeneis naucrates]
MFGSLRTSARSRIWFWFWTLILQLVLVSCSGSEGQRDLVGSFQPIVSVLGDDVILPCQLIPPLDLRRFTLEWSRNDVKPRQPRIVHLFRDRKEVVHSKLPSYVSRTSLFTGELSRGNVSLRILNVTSSDEGTYRCFIPRLAVASVIQLVINPDVTTRTTETPLIPRNLSTAAPEVHEPEQDEPVTAIVIVVVIVFFILILVLVAGGFFLKQYKKRDAVRYKTAQSCELPCSEEC